MENQNSELLKALHDYLQANKGRRGWMKRFADQSGVEYETIKRIAQQRVIDPRTSTTEKILKAAELMPEIKEASISPPIA